MFLLVSLLLAEPVSAVFGNWTVKRTADAITDNTEIDASLKGEGGKLTLLCSRRNLGGFLIFQPDVFLGGGGARYDWRDLYYRFDDLPAVRTSWKYLDEYASAPSAKEARKILGEAMKHKVLRVRAIRYDNRIIDATFDLNGMTAAFAEVATVCG